jgi:hypothetical protein
MSFSDDDLKRLKVMPLAEINLFLLSENKLGALLARLEPAEKLMHSLLSVIPFEERSSTMDNEWYAWRKASGKEGA